MKLVAKVGEDEWLISCPGLSRAGVRPGDRVTVLACGVDFISFGADTEPYVSLKFDRLLAVRR